VKNGAHANKEEKKLSLNKEEKNKNYQNGTKTDRKLFNKQKIYVSACLGIFFVKKIIFIFICFLFASYC